MFLRMLVSIILPILLIVGIIRWAWKSWKTAEIDDRIDEIQQAKKVSSRLNKIDTYEVKENRHDIKEFLDETEASEEE